MVTDSLTERRLRARRYCLSSLRCIAVLSMLLFSFSQASAQSTDKAVLTSPTPGSTLSGTSVTFEWTSGTGVSQYWLEIGTSGVGSANLRNRSEGTVTSATVTGLPTSGTVYVRLWSLISGVWQFNDYTFIGGGASVLVLSDISLTLNVLGFSESKISSKFTATGNAGASVIYTVQTQGAYGTAVINSSSGVFTYSVADLLPNPSVTSDRFVVRATAGSASVTANVIVNLRSDPLLANQWHLRSTGQYSFSDVRPVAGADINVSPAWESGYSGRGVKVAVVDSGLEISHEDLAANVDVGGSIDFRSEGTNPTNPLPDSNGDHGTKVAGIIGGIAFNGKGGRGIAYGSTLRGYNWLAVNSLTNFARSFGQDDRSLDNDVFNASFGGDETTLGVSYDSLPPFSNIRVEALNKTTALRGGKGAVVVMSAGNNFASNTPAGGVGTCSEAISFQVSCSSPAEASYKQSIVPIIVGALDADSKKATYSNSAPSVWISAPGGEGGYEATSTGGGFQYKAYKPAIISTNSSGCVNYSASYNNLDSRGASTLSTNCQYTAKMNGTSSAAAMVSGVVALMLEANPNLSYRDVAKILAETATRVDQSFVGVTATLLGAMRQLETGWIRNSAGYYFSPRYGFGALNAGAAVAMARTYTSYLPPVKFIEANKFQAAGDVTIRSNGRFVAFQVSSSITKVEKVFSIVNIIMRDTVALGSNAWGASCTQIELESPSGTKSILLNAANGFRNAVLDNVLLSSNAFYGENPNGTWRLTAYDWCLGVPVSPTQFSLSKPQEFGLTGT
jgi:subtilisin family serine protease